MCVSLSLVETLNADRSSIGLGLLLLYKARISISTRQEWAGRLRISRICCTSLMTVVVGEKLFLLQPLLLLLPVFFQYQLPNLGVLFLKRKFIS